jgi:16S rRNA (cytosine1402-N4)-methyltransferase
MYAAALAVAARPDNHIQRVWPMRSPSTGQREALSSAHFPAGHTGSPPAGGAPVEGLQMSQAFAHVPVLRDDVVSLFAAVPPGWVVDATVGGGGHAAALLAAHPQLRVVGIDRDPAAVAAAEEALAPFGERAVVRRARFDELASVVAGVLGSAEQRPVVSGVLFDLGVSSHQLDVAGRGFSYRSDAPLDMRMDPTSGVTAAELVNELDEDTLARLFAASGEGRFARRIARGIVAARPVATTGQLADVVRSAIPAAVRRTGGHPARRVFQALRIAVNEELDQLPSALGEALALLVPGGRCLALSYHSGEDRLVKSVFTDAETGGCQCPPELPCQCGAVRQYRLVFRGARRPGADEIAANPRAEAARLRAIERLEPPRSAGGGASVDGAAAADAGEGR